jgi:hypothetical protein
MSHAAPRQALGEARLATIVAALRGQGLYLDLGLATVRVRSAEDSLATALQAVYRHFEFAAGAHWADLHVDLVRPFGWRRWIKRQVVFRADSEEPFEPFAADTALPLMEWGANFLIGRRFNDGLLLHAGAVCLAACLDRPACCLSLCATVWLPAQADGGVARTLTLQVAEPQAWKLDPLRRNGQPSVTAHLCGRC